MEFMAGAATEDAKKDVCKTFINEEKGLPQGESVVSDISPGKTGSETEENHTDRKNSAGESSLGGDVREMSPAVEDTTSESTGMNQIAKEVDDDWMDILGSGHLKKRVLTPGKKDTRPQKSDILKVKYVGLLEDGTVIENVELAEINLGDNEVIHGLDFALSLMDEGETAEVLVTSRFAFGDMGRDSDVPPGATLRYTITLLEITPEPIISTVKCDDRLAVGLRKKERGNWWYTRDEHTLAINCYRRALEYFDDTEFPDSPSETQVRTILDERLKTYNNLGASQIKISSFDAALISFDTVLAAQPNNVKALFRKSSILYEKGQLQEAIAVLQKALSIEPENRRLQNDLQKLLAAQRRDNTKQRDLYKKMMGNSQDASEKKKNSPKSSKSSMKVVAVVTAFAVAIASYVVVKFYTKM